MRFEGMDAPTATDAVLRMHASAALDASAAADEVLRMHTPTATNPPTAVDEVRGVDASLLVDVV